ncbi:MAG: glycosyltransferase family 2 protein [Acidobacteria bacterium]|nr:glycosyltransferase family 2 protein [Acidobacteriota bacterium]
MSGAPTLAVLIPTFNRVGLLERVLRAYDRQDLPAGRFEVVVVDDGSSDATPAFLRGWKPERYGMAFQSQRNGGPARARNSAIRLSTSPLILFTGDDIVPDVSFVRRHLEAHARRPEREIAVLGLSVWPADLRLTATMKHIDGAGAEQFSYQYLQAGEEYDFRHFYTSNISLKRALLDCEPTYFSTEFQKAAFEDIELAYRLSLHGMRILYDARPLGTHYHHYDVRSFFRRQVGCGAMARLFYEKRPELRKWFGTPELEWARLEMLRDSPADRARIEAVAAALSAWEERMLRMAGFFEDAPDASLLDDLLLAVFRYAYVKGLAEASYPGLPSKRLCARLFLQLPGPACRRFSEQLRSRGIPVPGDDMQAILSIMQTETLSPAAVATGGLGFTTKEAR